MKILILLPVFLLLIITGCSSAPETLPDTKQISFLTNGIWIGFLPCEECEGIDYTVNFKDDFTFKQKFVYKGTDEEFIIDEGLWSFISDSVIELESSDYGKLFLVSGKKLIMLNEYEERFESSIEDKYTLHKDASTVKDIEDVGDVKDVKPDKDVVEMNSSSYQDKFLNGVDFIAIGSEPNWTLELDLEKSMSFAAMDDIKISTPAVEGIKAQDADVTLYRTKTESGELVITVIREDCEESISGEKFTYKVRVEAKKSSDKNYKTFEGCGKYLSDSRLNDIWVMEEMTGINFKKEKLQKGMPTFEFNLNELKFNGHAGCNSFSGVINVVSNKITFSDLIGTLMSCPNMKVEKAVIEALNKKTVTFTIDKLKLTLVSGKTKMVLKKVD
jgi:heat shock protein HslJ/uncharacterized membrane protein